MIFACYVPVLLFQNIAGVPVAEAYSILLCHFWLTLTTESLLLVLLPGVGSAACSKCHI